jgi:cytochrome P450
LTNLLNATIDDDDPEVTDKRQLDMPEMLSIVQQLLVAGNETTTKTLTEMIRLLAENPQEWARLKADPSRAEKVVEETLRLSTPTQGMWRVVTKDTVLGGVELKKGRRIVIVFASANRDEDLYEDPDAFVPDREHLRENLAFGKGIHFCLGANLSRLEGKVAAEELSKRLDGISLTSNNKFEYFPSFMLRGLTDLEIEFTPSEFSRAKVLS